MIHFDTLAELTEALEGSIEMINRRSDLKDIDALPRRWRLVNETQGDNID